MRTFGAFKAATLIILVLGLVMPVLAQDDKPLSRRDARRSWWATPLRAARA